jgi:transcriptional regulator GlxA family with amidase domain
MAIVTAALVLGKRRVSVRDLAAVTDTPLRTLEWRLAQCDMRPANEILGFILSLHIVWRLEAMAWPLKRIACAAGFTSSAALCRYVQRHIGERPRTMMKSLRFDKLASLGNLRRHANGASG